MRPQPVAMMLELHEMRKDAPHLRPLTADERDAHVERDFLGHEQRSRVLDEQIDRVVDRAAGGIFHRHDGQRLGSASKKSKIAPIVGQATRRLSGGSASAPRDGKNVPNRAKIRDRRHPLIQSEIKSKVQGPKSKVWRKSPSPEVFMFIGSIEIPRRPRPQNPRQSRHPT